MIERRLDVLKVRISENKIVLIKKKKKLIFKNPRDKNNFRQNKQREIERMEYVLTKRNGDGVFSPFGHRQYGKKKDKYFKLCDKSVIRVWTLQHLCVPRP